MMLRFASKPFETVVVAASSSARSSASKMSGLLPLGLAAEVRFSTSAQTLSAERRRASRYS